MPPSPQQTGTACFCSHLLAFLTSLQLPELFRTLDLSTHSATVECPYEVYSEKSIVRRATGRNAIVSSRSLAREWLVIDKITARKQELLVRTIAEKPTYGNYVRELHWTVLDTYQNITYSRELLDAQTHYWRNLYAEQGWAACTCGMRMVHAHSTLLSRRRPRASHIAGG